MANVPIKFPAFLPQEGQDHKNYTTKVIDIFIERSQAEIQKKQEFPFLPLDNQKVLDYYLIRRLSNTGKRLSIVFIREGD